MTQVEARNLIRDILMEKLDEIHLLEEDAAEVVEEVLERLDFDGFFEDFEE